MTRPQGKIKLEFEIIGVTEEQGHRFKESLDAIIDQGVLNLHDGKAILDFNYEGTLCGIRMEFNKWRRPKQGITPL